VARAAIALELEPGLAAAGALVSTLAFATDAVKNFGDTSAFRELIESITNIRIVDSPPGVRAEGDTTVRWHLKSDNVLRRLLAEGDLGLGESFMDGEWETDDHEELIRELLKLEPIKRNPQELGVLGLPLLIGAVVGVLKWKLFPENQLQDGWGAQKNIAAHYDRGGTEMYQRMLGPTMQYTCAYFHGPGMTLDEAQRAKMDLIAQKLDLRPGMRVLEIGCGYGALAHYLASEYGVHVYGCTLSKDQLEFAQDRFQHPNVEFRLQDYRLVEGKFDRAYSIGVFEHIGRNDYGTYFDKCFDCLSDDGIMLLHTIGFERSGEWNHNGFMNKYVFPGGELPHPVHLAQDFSDRWHMEDWHSFGLSYAETLRQWWRNMGDFEGYSLEKYPERFRRLWKHYLMCSAASFSRRRTKLWQIVYTKLRSERPADLSHHLRSVKVA
jgi:cyclopropane-fatty-acyl-phospholipid synthase